ncbi:MAG: hypothetical protein ABIB71_05465 [Candidatus Woesearchaeota archaeon]
METTKTEQKNTTAFQLKKLLGPSKKQDLGDVERWKQIPVEYIVTANTLGIELNDYALKRLNEAEDKNHALESIYVAQYFSKEARKLKKHDLANKLEAMVEDESLKTEDIALYAIKAIENELPKDKVLQKLAKAYAADKRIESVLPKENLENKVENILDVVLMPTDRERAYVYIGNLPKSMDNLTINIYSKNEESKEGKELAVKSLKSTKEKSLESQVAYQLKEKNSNKKTSLALYGSALGCLALGTGIGAAAGDAVCGAITGGIFGAIISTFGVCFTGCWYSENKDYKEYKNQEEQFKKHFPTAKVNWIKDEDLEAAYSSATSEKEMPIKGYKNSAVEEAAQYLVDYGRRVGVRQDFINAYQEQLENSLGKDRKISLK